MVLQVLIARITRGMKTYEAAQALNLDPQRWAKFERGVQDVPADVAKRASTLFEMPVEELFSPVETKPLAMAGRK